MRIGAKDSFDDCLRSSLCLLSFAHPLLRLSHSFEQLLQDSTWAAQASKNAASMAKSMAEPEADDIARAVVDDGKSEYPMRL